MSIQKLLWTKLEAIVLPEWPPQAQAAARLAASVLQEFWSYSMPLRRIHFATAEEARRFDAAKRTLTAWLRSCPHGNVGFIRGGRGDIYTLNGNMTDTIVGRGYIRFTRLEDVLDSHDFWALIEDYE